MMACIRGRAHSPLLRDSVVGIVIAVRKIEEHLARRDGRHECVVRVVARPECFLNVSMSFWIASGSLISIGPSTLGMTMCCPPSFSTNSFVMIPLKPPMSVATKTARLAKPEKPVHHVIAEARPAHFAVADDVDARLPLLRHGLLHSFLHTVLELRLIDRLVVELVPDHARQIVGARQAARMRGQNAIGAPLHNPPFRFLPPYLVGLLCCWWSMAATDRAAVPTLLLRQPAQLRAERGGAVIHLRPRIARPSQNAGNGSVVQILRSVD